VANTQTLIVQCAAVENAGAATTFASLTPAGPPAMTTLMAGVSHIFGGQGQFVNLVSSAVNYAGGTFSFNTTVQNAINLPMASADGVARDDAGVRVFIQTGPTTTSGSGTITVSNATGTATFLSTNQSYYQYGGKIGGVDQAQLGGDGILSSGEVSATKNWQFAVPGTVTTFTFEVYVATTTPSGTAASVAPQVTSIDVPTMIPGAAATLTGTNFNATPGVNVVTIGGQTATVTGGNTTTLNVTVPCASSGSVPVQVTNGSVRGASFAHPLAVTQRTVALGQALVLSTSSSSWCNELPSVGGTARYLVSIFSTNSSPSSNVPFQFSADNRNGAPAVTATRVASAPSRVVAPVVGLDILRNARTRLLNAQHTQLLDANAAAYQRLRAKFGAQSTRLPSGAVQRSMLPPPATRTFRVSNLNATGPNNICNSYYLVNATLVYNSGKVALYEDDATPNVFKDGVNATMHADYIKIGDQFNADMEPIIRNNFGDVLRRDAVTDNNGVVVALFTPRINTSFAPTAGFVVSCDQYPNDDTSSPSVGGPFTGSAGSQNGASNFGEVFYANQPVDDGSGDFSGLADDWFKSVRSTFIHETKHLAAYAARVANSTGNFEVSWLEEGLARHSEELWMRNAVDLVAWKGHTGYGSFGNPVNVYCDVRANTSFPECAAGKRPASIMYNHFYALNNYLTGVNATLESPFGPSPDDHESDFYGISWSLVRYALDRYGASDATFLTALTQASTTGAANLTARAGVSIDQLLGAWGLTLYAADYPGLGSPSADIKFPTWDLRSIYAGLNADFGSAPFNLVFPLVPTPLAFGSAAPLSTTTLRGGGARYFEFSGTQTAAQLLRLESNGGGLPASDLRIAVTRLQ
jgi:hypothetical protein